MQVGSKMKRYSMLFKPKGFFLYTFNNLMTWMLYFVVDNSNAIVKNANNLTQ